jgi:hypothetical protein
MQMGIKFPWDYCGKIGEEMDIENREDLSQFKELTKFCDTANTPFEDVMSILINFSSTVLTSEREFKNLKIDSDIAQTILHFLNQAKRSLRNEIVPAELDASRVSVWELFDKAPQGSAEKYLCRIVVMCLYDKDSAEYDTFGSDPMFEAILSCLNDLGKGYCKAFVDFAREYFSQNGR